jgi:hypothetical protein
MSLSTLQTMVEDTLENTFATTPMATITRNAEYRIFDAVDIPAFRNTATTALVPNVRTLNAPTDFRAPVSFAVIDASGNYSYLLYKQQDFILEAYPNPTVTGTPVHYALNDEDSFIFGPTPSAALSTLITYSYYPLSLVDATEGTWLGNEFPLVLIKAAILEGAIYLKAEEDLLAKYQNDFEEALLQLKNYANGRLQSDKYRGNELKHRAL